MNSEERKEILRKGFKAIGTNVEVAEKLGLHSRSCITHWINGDRKIPPEHVVMLEWLSDGELNRYYLRPDVFYEVHEQGNKLYKA